MLLETSLHDALLAGVVFDGGEKELLFRGVVVPYRLEICLAEDEEVGDVLGIVEGGGLEVDGVEVTEHHVVD